MNFKRLEIFGFKSFADKIHIDFDEGITGIVGPNGSGKSNFSDAIKWVLGEQRAGELRGKSMQDVIFNGTEGRRGSMSYCEVTLVFDNKNKLFSTLEFDEVSITRKLYRSGDSEYLLNRVPCRLKDIRNIITDTGLGKDGYSIIGQGRVEKIITSKPEDRRNIFEEAAGIAKFKARKIEAENKLVRTEEHLTRLEDVIREIERQLGPLSRQSEDAKKFNELYTELKDLEVNHYLYTYEKTNSERINISNRLAGISEEKLMLENDKHELDIQYSKLMAEINNTDVLITNLRENITQLMLSEERKSGEGKLFTERLTTLKAEKVKLIGNIERMKGELEELSQVMATTYSSSNEVLLELEEKKTTYAQFDADYIRINDEIVSRESALESSSKAIFEAIDQLAGVKADMSKLGAESEYLREKLDETIYLIDRAKTQIEIEENNRISVNTRLDDAKSTRDKIYKERNLVKNKMGELRLEQNVLNDTIRQLAGSISSLETKSRLLSNIRDQYEGYQAPVQRLMQEAKNDHSLSARMLGVVAEIIKVPQKLEVAIETALGGALQNIVTENDNDVKFIIELLKTKRMGRITFLPLNTFKAREFPREHLSALNEKGCLGIASKIIGYDSKFNNIISGLLGSTMIVDNYDNAIAIFKKYRSSFRIVTIDGEILAVQGSISGGSKKADSTSLLSQEREIEQAKLLYDKSKIEYENKTQRLKICAIEYDEQSNLLKDLEEKLNVSEVAYATETERENKLTEKIDQLLEELSNRSAIKEQIEERLGMIDIRLTDTDKLEGDIHCKRANVDDMQNKHKVQFEAKKAEKENLAQKMTAIRVEIAEIEAKHRSVIDEIERTKQDGLRLQNAISEDQSALATVEAGIKINEQRANNLVLNSQDKDKFESLQNQLKDAENYKRDINSKLLEINSTKEEKNTSLSECLERRLKEESALEKLDGNLQAMLYRLEEEYSINHETACTLARDDYDDYGAASQIVNVKRSIAKLGPINPAAIEQYEVEGQRHKQLTTERDDVVKAAEDLQTIIRDLSKEMLERFEIEFAKISANFEVAFRDIFGGGKGALVIDKDAEDPLSAGVEIYAQPPGKKLSQITLFSGGEKALTAIAILFAILKTKPMPFCVLDEIEAALDESNARLFAKYLKRFTKDTQFIVITHRKPTMEQADRLYGVTMEEKGVSKVVSVALSEAVKVSEPVPAKA